MKALASRGQARVTVSEAWGKNEGARNMMRRGGLPRILIAAPVPGAEAADPELPPLLQAWQEAHDAADEPDQAAPVFNWDTKQVTLGDVMLGRITTMRPGTPGESLSIYCRAHQCAKCVQVRKAPSHQAILQWFARGQDLPRGAAHKAEHLRMWPAA